MSGPAGCWLMLALATAGCRATRVPGDLQSRGAPPVAATSPALEIGTFEAPGVTLAYPADAWVTTPHDGYVLHLSARDGSRRSLSLDIPKLPPHIPGLIPLRLVVNGYIDDLKRQHPGIQVSAPETATLAGAGARRVRAVWAEGGEARVEQAVLTVHGDRVYIFRANSGTSDEAAARAGLDQVLASVRWK